MVARARFGGNATAAAGGGDWGKDTGHPLAGGGHPHGQQPQGRTRSEVAAGATAATPRGHPARRRRALAAAVRPCGDAPPRLAGVTGEAPRRRALRPMETCTPTAGRSVRARRGLALLRGQAAVPVARASRGRARAGAGGTGGACGGGGSRKGSEERPAARLAAGGVAGVVDRGCGHDWRTGVRRADGWESAGRQARAERRAPARRQGPGKSNTLSRRAWHVGVPRAGRAPFRPTPASLDASTLLDVGSARLPLSRPRIRKPTRRPAPQPRHAPALWPPPVAPSLPVG